MYTFNENLATNESFDGCETEIINEYDFSEEKVLENDFMNFQPCEFCDDAHADDKILVEAAKNGDSLAITLLVVKYRSFLDKYVGLLNVPSRYKEDFIQEGLIGLLKAVRTYDVNVGCSFSTYGWRCIKNSVISELRRQKRRGINNEVSIEQFFDISYDKSKFDGTFEVVTKSVAISPESEYIDMESSAQLHDTIFSVLSTYEAKVFEMYLAEIPYSTIAIRLGKDIKSIDNAIQRIKNKLKKLV